MLTVEACEEIHQVVAAGHLQCELALPGKRAEFHQIPPVSGDGIRRQSFLHLCVGQKRRDGGRNFHQSSAYPPSPAPALRRTAIPYTSWISWQRKIQASAR